MKSRFQNEMSQQSIKANALYAVSKIENKLTVTFEGFVATCNSQPKNWGNMKNY